MCIDVPFYRSHAVLFFIFYYILVLNIFPSVFMPNKHMLVITKPKIKMKEKKKTNPDKLPHTHTQSVLTCT